MSISLAFSLGKPCCNKKAGKNAISCKFNYASIKADKDVLENLSIESSENTAYQKSTSCKNKSGLQCTNSMKKPWWKFWATKSNQGCPCAKQQVATVK